MSSVIGSLRVNLGLDSAKFESGARKVQNPLKAMKAQFMAVSGAALALGAALSTMALKGAADVDAAAKSARRLGTSIGGFRALELAAGEAGVSLSTLTDGVQTMDREIAKGSKGAARALDTLGLAAKDLEGLEADQKVALIADSIKDLGLTTGQASVVLQDLGVRNREMVLAVLGGGDAFRQARADIEDYGLAISQTDSDSIEQANDRIGRLGLITQYAGQQLAIALVPALGAFAQAMTDSLREGGLLRAMIDGFVDNIDTLIASTGVLVGFLGVKLAVAMASAAGATGLLTGALVLLRGAIFATGIGALVIGAGYLIAKFAELVTATGGFGEALVLLGEVASGVWDGIVTSAGAIPDGLFAVWSGIKADFFAMLSDMMGAWSGFLADLNAAADKLKIPGTEGMGLDLLGNASAATAGAAAKYDAKSQSAASAAREFSKAAGTQAAAGFEMAKSALSRLTAAVSDNAASTIDATADADALAAAIDGVADSASGGGKGGGGGGGAAKAVEKIKPALDSVSSGFDTFKSSVATAFEGLITGASSFKDALAGVLNSLASVFAQAATSAIFGGLKIPGFATGTPYAPGGLAMVGERGPELVNLPRGSQVYNTNRTQDMLGGGASSVEVRVIGGDLVLSDDGQIMARVQVVADQTKREAVSATLGRMNKTKTGWA